MSRYIGSLSPSAVILRAVVAVPLILAGIWVTDYLTVGVDRRGPDPVNWTHQATMTVEFDEAANLCVIDYGTGEPTVFTPSEQLTCEVTP